MASSPHGAQTCFSLWPNLLQIGGEQRIGGTSRDLVTASISLKGFKGKGAGTAWKSRPTVGQSRLRSGDDTRKRKFLFSLKENFPTIEDL